MSEIFLTIVNRSISASWLVLAVLILRLGLKKAPKWFNVLLWGFVAIRLVCPFTFESMLSLIPSAETISPQIMTDPVPQISTGISALNSVLNPVISGSLTPAPGDSANPLQIWIPVVTAVWVAGIALMLIYTAISYFLLRRKVDTAVRLRNNIYQSENVDSPFVLGIFRPAIYLPFQMDSGNLEYVIAHEEAHIRRKDHWWKPFGFILLAVHWFNPLMWVGYILLCRDIELACDEKVIKELDNDNRANYTQALVDCSINRRSIAACPLAFGEVGVKERVKSVMNYKKPGFWIMVAAAAICIVVAVCFLTNPMEEVKNPWVREYEPGTVGMIGQVDKGKFESISEDFAIGADQYGRAVFKDPHKAFRTFTRLFAHSIKEIQTQHHLMPISGKNYAAYKTYGWQTIVDSQELKEQMSFVTSFLDIYENSFAEEICKISQFRAMVIEVHDEYLLVEPEEGSVERNSADRIEVYLQDKTSWPIPRVGDKVLVVYDGQLQETYPARITNVYRIEIMNYDAGPVETFHGNMKTYYKNSDGTWQVDGRIYKYRLEISGQVDNPACPGPTTFVYLSNLENITFKQAWNALFSGNCADWFLVDEAVLVDWPTGNVTYAGYDRDDLTEKPESRLDLMISAVIGNLRKNEVPDGLLSTESHIVLAHEVVSGTPVEGQTEHVQEETVFVYFLNMRFRVGDGELEEFDSKFSQLVITFCVDENGYYNVKEILQPADSEAYDQVIVGDFIYTSDDAAELEEKYGWQLRQNCQRTVEEYLDNLSVHSSTMPGQNTHLGQYADYAFVISSILYDLDGDGENERCSLTYGPTSGLFSFVFNAASVDAANPDPKYSATYVLSGHYDLSFDLTADGVLRIKGEDPSDTGEAVYFDVAVKDGELVLQCEEEGVFLE